MKRQTYFQVHRNKKPNKFPERKPNYKRAHLALITAMGVCQMSVIGSQVFKSPAQKALEIATTAIQTAEAIKKLFSKKQKYLDRIKKSNHDKRRSSKIKSRVIHY